MENTKIYDSKEFKSEYISGVVKEVALILEERGYNPVNQIVGYLMSGDPGYISSYKEARSKISEFERTKILELLFLWSRSKPLIVEVIIDVPFIIIGFELKVSGSYHWNNWTPSIIYKVWLSPLHNEIT